VAPNGTIGGSPPQERANHRLAPSGTISGPQLREYSAAAQKQELANQQLLQRNPKAKVNKHHINFLNQWWRLAYRREEMLDTLKKQDRYIATSRVASESAQRSSTS
jgi:hypothetical protein